LFQSLKKLPQKPIECYRKPSEIMSWAKAKFFMVQTLQERTNVCRHRWEFWTTVEKHNTGKQSKSSRGYSCRSLANYPRCLWDSRTVIRDHSTHFGGQFEHETHFCEICAKTAKRRPEDPSSFCLQGTQTSQGRSRLHLQYHNRWWNVGETKQQSSLWKSSNSPRPKKARQVRSNGKSMFIFFSDIQGTVHKKFVPLVKTSMASFTVRFWSGWGRAFDANVQTSGWTTIGFSTMTTRPLTYHSLFDNSWLPKTLQWFPTSTPIAWPRPLRHFPIPQDEITAEKASCWHDWGDPRRIATDYRHTFENFQGCINHGKHAGIAV
jgi:hypothetical protein